MSLDGNKPLVLHLAVDYPNFYRKENTVAVRNFVKANEAELDYLVIALTRTPNPFAKNNMEGDGNGDRKVISMRYWGFPYGIGLAISMCLVAIRVRKIVKKMNIAPVLVHAHKLTFEGIAGWLLARRLSIPLVVSVRGEADSKVLRFKPHYRFLLQRVLSDTIRIYYVSAWFKPLLNDYFFIDKEKQYLLPNFVKNNEYVFDIEPQANKLLTVLDLNVYRKKGLDLLLMAFRDSLRLFPSVHLDIVGRGNSQSITEIKKLITSLDIVDRVTLVGEISNNDLLLRLPTYAGMALPSHNETFGMIYVESLLACVPILHSKNTGIDGFVDFVKSRAVVDPKDITSIQNGLINLLTRQKEYRIWLKDNRQKIIDMFEFRSYVSEYGRLVQKI